MKKPNKDRRTKQGRKPEPGQRRMRASYMDVQQGSRVGTFPPQHLVCTKCACPLRPEYELSLSTQPVSGNPHSRLNCKGTSCLSTGTNTCSLASVASEGARAGSNSIVRVTVTLALSLMGETVYRDCKVVH